MNPKRGEGSCGFIIGLRLSQNIPALRFWRGNFDGI